jgi:hypothetical protein
MKQTQKLRGEHPPTGVFDTGEWLGMINVKLIDRFVLQQSIQEFPTIAHSKSHIVQASLISTTCGIANDCWQSIDSQMIPIWATYVR